MSVVASYVNTEHPGAGDAVVFTREDNEGVQLDCPSPEGASDAQVGAIHPTYGYVLAVKKDVPPPVPSIPHKRAQHYQTPVSNMPVYERMDSVVSGGMSAMSPVTVDPSRPLMETPVEADNDAVCRKESSNPVYSNQEEGNDRKRVFSGETEGVLATYESKSRRKCCDIKATVLSFFLLILFFMSAASLMLNLLMLFGGLNLSGCASCTGKQGRGEGGRRRELRFWCCVDEKLSVCQKAPTSKHHPIKVGVLRVWWRCVKGVYVYIPHIPSYK